MELDGDTSKNPAAFEAVIRCCLLYTSYEARSEVFWAGSLSHNGLTGCGRAGDWACHQLEHELGGMFDVTHGAGLAAVWGSWARYVYKSDVARFAKLAVEMCIRDSTKF